jgi:ABC-type Zn uptake system ZnuABC Zn-binding protein ZnuA
MLVAAVELPIRMEEVQQAAVVVQAQAQGTDQVPALLTEVVVAVVVEMVLMEEVEVVVLSSSKSHHHAQQPSVESLVA